MRVIVEMLSYPFLVRAFVGGIFVSLCASLLGVSLVLKRYSMIGDGLSHVSFGALSVAIAAGWSPLAVSIPVVVLAAFFLLRITENGKLKSDAAIAMISASALAIGILVTSMTTGVLLIQYVIINAGKYAIKGQHPVVGNPDIVPFYRCQEVQVGTLFQLLFDLTGRKTPVRNDNPPADVVVTDESGIGTGIDAVAGEHFRTDRLHRLNVIGIQHGDVPAPFLPGPVGKR